MKDLSSYWLYAYKRHRDLRWIARIDWDEDEQDHIDNALESTKAVLGDLEKLIGETL